MERRNKVHHKEGVRVHPGELRQGTTTRTPCSTQSKRTTTTAATNSTTNSRAQLDTPTIQKLVSNLRARQGTPRQLQETTITTTHHSRRLCLHQITARPKGHTSLNSSWCYYTTVYGGNNSGKTNDGLRVNNLQAFIFERGRTQGILQSDNEDTLNALLKATAAKVGSMAVRHAAATVKDS